MSKLSDFKVLCFDVYGTLIDWETGVLTALQPLLTTNQSLDKFSRTELLEAFHAAEAAQQSATPDLSYSQLLTTIHPQIASHLNLTTLPTAEQSIAFGNSVASWPAFPDTVDALTRLSRHYKLVVLSNVDHASFSHTLSGPLADFAGFDLVITAQDVGSYKPALQNFEAMLRQVKAEFGAGKEQVLQTAQSQFHDHQPTRKVGIRSAWIERPGCVMGNRADPVFDYRFDTLGDMADAVEKEVVGNTTAVS